MPIPFSKEIRVTDLKPTGPKVGDYDRLECFVGFGSHNFLRLTGKYTTFTNFVGCRRLRFERTLNQEEFSANVLGKGIGNETAVEMLRFGGRQN